MVRVESTSVRYTCRFFNVEEFQKNGRYIEGKSFNSRSENMLKSGNFEQEYE